jgi:Na+/proline symporter
MKILAQDLILQPSGGPAVDIQGPLKIWKDGRLQAPTSLTDIINQLLLFLLPIAAVILFFVLVAGGFNVLTSQGSPEKIKNGRAMITAGLIGFFILVFAVAIVKIIGYVLNINQNSPI